MYDMQGEMDAWLTDRLGHGLAESTRRSYDKHWEKWKWWRSHRGGGLYLEGEGRRGAREDEQELLQFVAFYDLMGSPVNVLRTMLFAIQRMHKEAGAGDMLEHKKRLWL
eukprot:34778-Amphidinium_carterae.1